MAFDVATPGNIVVPLSSIIDQLQGKLTSAQIDALVQAIIGGRKDKVAPGDLITADLLNQILTDIANLNVEVARLTGGDSGATANTHAVSTLEDTWSGYGTLVKKGTLQPDPTSSDAIRSDLTIAAHFQDVMYAALSGLGMAYLGDTNALLATMQELYDLQHDVVVLFSGTIPGVTDPSAQQRFASLLNAGLDSDPAGGGISLKKALANADLSSGLDAQDRINGMIQNQGGNVTTGNLTVTYLGAVGSTETLVIGSSQPVLYRFSVTNGTNQDLDVQLQPSFLPPQDAWTAQTTVLGLDGSVRSHIPLKAFDPSNPNNTDSTQEVRVAVMTPPSATDGQKGTLQLYAFVPPPVNVGNVATRDLFVHTTAVQQNPGGIVAYSARTPVVSQNPLTVHNRATVTFEFTYTPGVNASATRDFRFTLDLNQDPGTSVGIDFGDLGAFDGTLSTATKLVSSSFTLTSGVMKTVVVGFYPRTGSSGVSLTFTATVASATDNVTQTSSSVTLSVQ